MSHVRLLVGTRKGAFILTSEGKRRLESRRPALRRLGDLSPQGLPRRSAAHLRFADERLVRTDHPAFRRRRQNVEHAGTARRCPIRTSTPGESNKFVYDTSAETGAPYHASVVRRYAASLGVQARLAPRALAHRSGDHLRRSRGCRPLPLDRWRRSWHELAGLRGHGSGPRWQPGAGGMCLHTILLDPHHPDRIFIAISAAGAFRTDDGGKTWKPINRGLKSQYIPDPDAEVGHCVHRIAMHPSRPNVLFMQKHWDVMRSDDARRHVARSERQSADRLRLSDRGARARAGDDLRRADQERLGALSARRQAARVSQPHAAATTGSRSPRGCRSATAT